MNNNTVTARLLPALLALILAGCFQEERQTDPGNRISFVIPDGWEAKRGSNNTRFAPPGPEGHRVHIQINTLDRADFTLEQERDSWLAAQEKQGHTILLTDRQYQQGPFKVLEYAHTATVTHGDVIWHHALMGHEDFRVPAYIMVAPEAYETYLPTLREVIGSVEVVDSVE